MEEKVKEKVNEEMQKLRGLERIVVVKLLFRKLLPVQQKRERRQKISLGLVWSGKKSKKTKVKTEESIRPDVLQETSELVERHEDAKVFTFEKNGEGGIDLTELLCGRYGIIHKAFVEYWRSLRKAPYIVQMLEALSVEPLESEPPLVKPTYEYGDNDPEKPFSLPVPRSRGTTRQMEYSDYLMNKEVSIQIRFPSELPVSKGEFLGLLHGLEFMSIGPFKRGSVEVASIDPIQNWYRGTEARAPEQIVP